MFCHVLVFKGTTRLRRCLKRESHSEATRGGGTFDLDDKPPPLAAVFANADTDADADVDEQYS